MKRRTKIVATVTPRFLEEDLLREMAIGGVDVFRLNFSYGTHREHGEIIDKIKNIRSDLSKPMAIIQDLTGPGARIGNLDSFSVYLSEGSDFILSADPAMVGNKNGVYVDHPSLASELEKGDKVTIADGEVELEVYDISEGEIYCRVSRGGEIQSKRSLTFEGKSPSSPALREKDKADVEFGLKKGVDFVAMSFVRSTEDVESLRSFISEKDEGGKPDIIAKIETKEAIDNLDGILKSADAIMVARGDLASEISPEEVPFLQKDIIKRANSLGKPVITATQMLESMVNSSSPTRAETSDVANAILDGTDAIMLSAETAIGKYPILAVEEMGKIAIRTEKERSSENRPKYDKKRDMQTADAVSAAVVNISYDLKSRLVVALTDSGFTGRMISRHKPGVPIITMTAKEETFRKLALCAGCVPLFTEKPKGLEDAFSLVREYALKHDLAQRGDRAVVAAGVPFERPDAKTNMLFVETF
ncbi:MAG: pyruvate kinase [Patescibacteria group bacterium]